MLQNHAHRSAPGRNTWGCVLILLFLAKRDQRQARGRNRPLFRALTYFFIHLIFQSQRFIWCLDFGFSVLAIFFNNNVLEKKLCYFLRTESFFA